MVERILCLSVGTISLIWILVSDLRRMIVPVVPLVLLACSGAAWKLESGVWEDLVYSAFLAVPFLYLYARKGLGEGDVLVLVALSPWFYPREYLLVIVSGFALGVVWGVARLARAGELKGWLCRVSVGVLGEIPERPEEALSKAECVPLAAAVSMPALIMLVVEACQLP